MSPLKRTPLFPLYADEPGVRCIDFGGWELPVQFTGIQKEHDAVRQYAGLFDVSHMGEVIVIGTYAEAYLQVLTTNNVAKLKDGQAQYSLMCCPDGGVVDDLLVYRLSADQFMLVVNASNIDKDLEWMDRHLIGDVVIQNISEQTALLALQGPLAETILSRLQMPLLPN
ncbi:glycine cleavage system T protein [Paenibacillus sp. PvR098]|nr:glycine cleavage system T protein [Paenibacillus sp. PvR098]